MLIYTFHPFYIAIYGLNMNNSKLFFETAIKSDYYSLPATLAKAAIKLSLVKF